MSVIRQIKLQNFFLELHNTLTRAFLITNYKSFIRTDLDCGNTIYDQAYNNSFFQNGISSVQCTLATPGVIIEAVREKL